MFPVCTLARRRRRGRKRRPRQDAGGTPALPGPITPPLRESRRSRAGRRRLMRWGAGAGPPGRGLALPHRADRLKFCFSGGSSWSFLPLSGKLFSPWCLSSWPFKDPFRVFSNPLESLGGLIFYPLDRSFGALGGNPFPLADPWRILPEPSPTPWWPFVNLSGPLWITLFPFVPLRGYLFSLYCLSV